MKRGSNSKEATSNEDFVDFWLFLKINDAEIFVYKN